MEFNLAQAIGLLASATIITAFFFKGDVKLKLIAALGHFLFIIHFFMLGATAGAITSTINSTRGLASIKFHKSKRVMFIFMSFYILAALLFVEQWIDFLPYATGVIGCYALYMLSGLKLRLLITVSAIFWLIYNIYFLSLGGILTEVFVISANCLTIYRILKGQKTPHETSG